MFDKVANVAKTINNGRTPVSVFLSVAEETGELSKELRAKYMNDCYKTEGEDGILGESVDIIIGILDILYLEGYSKDWIDCTIDKKLSKWKEKSVDEWPKTSRTK